MAGYSKRTLVEKLGIRPEDRISLLAVPASVQPLLAQLPPGVKVARRVQAGRDFVLLFVRRRAELERRLGPVVDALEVDGSLWVSWPKKTSGLESDLSFDQVQAAGLSAGLVDVKICAVDEQWSGLRFVYRRDDREAVRRRRAAAGRVRNP